MRAGLAPAPGSVIGGFRLDRWLGGGDDTDVWRADGDGIVVALKLLRDPDDVFAQARMAREAAALRRVRHDHVIALFAVGEEDGEPYLATPLLDAGTLAMLLDEGRIDLVTAAATLAPIASALAAAHGEGVVHRDVKPANVMLTTEGPVLVDFGAAALDGVTLDGWVDGAPAWVATPAYAAPESTVSAALDVWSLGVMLLEALTGRTGISGAALDAAVPAEAGALIAACCAADPSGRPSAASVADRLRALAGDAVPPAVAPPIVLDDARPADRLAEPPAFESRHGRELEVAQLLDTIDAAQAARELRGVLVTAPPGMGKSWLLETAAARAVAEGAVVLRAACTEAVNDLRALAPWVRRVGDHSRLVDLVGEHHADLVAHVTGIESGGGVEADPATIADAFAALLGSCNRVVAVVDDLHHAGDDLVDLLGRLAFRSGIAGALWLGARPGAVDGDDLDVRTLALGPLPDDVIVDLAGAEAVEIAGGNPLLARELQLAQELAPARAPISPATDVRVLIGQRLERLGPAAAGELDLAATCGEVFWPETIGVTQALGVLCRSGLVRLRPDSAIAGSTEAEWTHPLLREVAYDRLDTDVRRDSHVTVAHRLDDADTEPEAIAHHAAAAFELGARGEAAFVGDVSARAARTALDRFALANADRWTSLVRETGHEPVPGTADTLEAELLLRRGEFERSGTLADHWTDRPDDVGTHALAVSAEAHLATGEYDTAERAAAAALDRIPDSRWRDQITSAYVELLKRRGDYEQAANLAAAAANGARARGDRVFAARLEIQRALCRVYLANTRGEGVVPHIEATRAAVRELEQLGDNRAYLNIATEIATSVATVDPASGLDVLTRAIGYARDLDASTQLGPLLINAAESSFELGRADDALDYMRQAEACPLDRATSGYQSALLTSTLIARGEADFSDLRVLRTLANDAVAPVSTRTLAVVAGLWAGRMSEVDLTAVSEAHVAHVIARLAVTALTGPPWPKIATDLPMGASNDAALVCYLAGRNEQADQFLRRRFAYLEASGAPRERFNWYYPGPLVMALGPSEVSPQVEWLISEILEPTYPNLWAIHRVLCALLLIERGHDKARELQSAGLSILERVKPDPAVEDWLLARLKGAPALSDG